MSFKRRSISITFALIDDFFNEQKQDVLDLNGYRCEAQIQNPGGGLAAGFLNLRIFGMKISDMNKISTGGLNPLFVRNNQIAVNAGDEESQLKNVFTGTIRSAYIDYSSSPDVSFNVQAQTGYIWQLKTASANSYPGEADVATIIESLARQAKFGFVNNGVDLKINNPNLSGTLVQQMRALAEAAGIMLSIESETVYIWPNGKTRDDLVVSIGPKNGLVGYPTFWEAGIQIQAEFNPDLVIGRKIKIESSAQNASGEWFVQFAAHDLSTLSPGGPWFSTCRLTSSSFYISRTP